MDVVIEITKEGSSTLFLPHKNEHYHSIHGAIQEAECVYINAGLEHIITQNPINNPIYIFEMGFGTGLNAFLSLIKAHKTNTEIFYTTIEAYPLEQKIWQKLNYSNFVEDEFKSYYSLINASKWDEITKVSTNAFTSISENFSLLKVKGKIENIELPTNIYDVVYYDAFAPNIQPELWEEGMFKKLYKSMCSNSVLSTYCAQGQLKRNLKQSGFTVFSLKGPKGKREITQAIVSK